MKRRLLNWTSEIRAFIEARSSMPRHELTRLVNEAFDTSFTYEQVRGYCKRNRIMTGRDGRYQKGNIPLPHARLSGPNSTSFKKGHRPHNWCPIGHVRVIHGGYYMVKVQDTGRTLRDYVFVHHLVWILHNGPIPDGHKVIFIDGDPSNLEPDNLELVSNGELAVINKRPLRFLHPDLRRPAIALGRLVHLTGKKTKEMSNR